MQSLKYHLLSQLLGLDYDEGEQIFSPEEHNEVRLVNINSVVESKIIQFNYTTYDIWQNHDTTRTTRGDVMMTCLRDEEHLFWYAQILWAFHIKVHFCPEGVSHSKQSMEVLWVHWLGIDKDHRWGFKEARLPKVGCVPNCMNHIPFGFLDPSLVICACHLIPAFCDGRTNELLQAGESLARLPGKTDD